MKLKLWPKAVQADQTFSPVMDCPFARHTATESVSNCTGAAI